ncbi:hypothetical protein FB451DRAFT_1183060 [Mycena latifolia]|nr:hypothetical protein FB451DRAFT_1183060 [Mycena latifolia]
MTIIRHGAFLPYMGQGTDVAVGHQIENLQDMLRGLGAVTVPYRPLHLLHLCPITVLNSSIDGESLEGMEPLSGNVITTIMPFQANAAQIRFNHVATALNAAVTTLGTLSEGLKASSLEPILNVMQALLMAVQTVKRHQDDCAQMLEQIHKLLYAIIHVHIKSDTGGELPPPVLNHLGKFTEQSKTLHKIHTFVEAQQEKSKIKQFFRQGEMKVLLRDCQMGLEHALEEFKIQGVTLLSNVAEMQKHADNMHEEVLEMLSALSNVGTSDGGSTISRVLSNSSNSLSLLPSEPKIFHGRHSEVSVIIQAFGNATPRIAILGAGGMGKTSLARAILHHSEISARYDQCRVFVPCDTASSTIQLAGLIGAHLGLKQGTDLTQPVIRHFTSSPPSLLILDNLETLWEPRESRAEVEKFLALLADVDHLALIITMRGAERPANVRWTRPFLEPLNPLTQDAARQTFIDIADADYTFEEIDKILLLVDNMPLAIDLIAHLVDYEGFASVLDRWESERTSLLSEGHDRCSNLDLSISLSLESPRMLASPEAQELLSLLSILPDGLSNTELLQSKLPINNVLACRAILLCTSLAYIDAQKRLKALVPVREYIHKARPPMAHIVKPLRQYFQELLEVYETYHGHASTAGAVARITSNLANIHNILVNGLHQHNPELVDIIYCACHWDRFSVLSGRGPSQVIDLVPNVLPHPRNHRFEVCFAIRLLNAGGFRPIPEAQNIVDQALESFAYFDDPDLKCSFYDSLAEYFRDVNTDIPRAISFAQTGLSLSISTGNIRRQSDLLSTVALIQWTTGDYSAGQENAHESRRLAKICGNLFKEAWALQIESTCWHVLGNYKHSITLSTQARDLLRLCGMSGGQLDNYIMGIQAEVHLLKSEYLEARNVQTQIMHCCSIEQNPYQHCVALLSIAQIDVEIGVSRHELSKNLAIASQFFVGMGYPEGVSYCDIVKAAMDVKEGDFLRAICQFQKSLTLAWGHNAEAVSYCLERLGDVCLWPATDDVSYNETVTFLVHSLKLTQKREVYKALQFLGDVYLAHGDQQTAISLWVIALEGFTQMDVHRSRAECMLRLGDISKMQGDLMKAGEHWKTARPLFQRSSQEHQIAHIDERLAGIGHDLLDGPTKTLIRLLDLNAPTASPDELDLGLMNTTLSKVEEVESVSADDGTDAVFVPA